ncbi:MAG: hypothetical protein VX346_26745 [Planctomycetota bacterium]|nr:hypothetical protein [Planctomycetota bacterium]
MPSDALIAFQEKLASDPQLQEKFVDALSRFIKAVMDSGQASGHVFASEDVFRFIQETYLPEPGQGDAGNVFVKLFIQTAGQSSLMSQRATLHVGQNPELLDALKKPAAEQSAASATSPGHSTGVDSEPVVVEQAAVAPATSGASQGKSTAEFPAAETADPVSAAPVPSQPSIKSASLSKASTSLDGGADQSAARQESSADSGAAGNQANTPWWKFW